MLKNIGLKNSLISSLFGISMLTTLASCGTEISEKDVFNKMTSSEYSVVQLKSTQFELQNEYAINVKYKDEKNCRLEDVENSVYIYAAEESSLSLNSKSEDDYIISSINTFFLDEGFKIASNTTSVTYKTDEFTKILFSDLVVTTKDEKTYSGKLSIIDYGMNETFVLAYADGEDKINADYVVRSLKTIDTSKDIIVVSEIPAEPIEEVDMTYDKYVENNKVVVDDVPVVEEKEEINAEEILANRKTFNGDFFSFSGYYGLDRIISKNENDLNYGSSYLCKNKDFILGLDIINLNQVNEIYGDAKTDSEKIANISTLYKDRGNIDLAAIYTNEEILDCYNISVSNGVLGEYLTQYGLENDYNTCYKGAFLNGSEWMVVRDFNSKVTLEGYEDCSVAFAFTIDDTSTAYMIAFVYTPELEDVIEITLNDFTIKGKEQVTISDNQKNMYGEFLNVN